MQALETQADYIHPWLLYNSLPVSPRLAGRVRTHNLLECMAIGKEPKPSKDHVSVRRISQQAESRRLRHQINLEVLITLRRALPRDVTDQILKSSMCKIQVQNCPDKLYAVDPEPHVRSKPCHKHCQRRANPPPKHRGR